MEKKIILIVDDDQDLVRSYQLILEHENFEVQTAPNSKEGIVKLTSKMPDLIILDIMMDSTLEGYRMLNTLKNNDIYKKIPVIMISAMKDAIGVNFRSAVEDAELLPNVVFLDKPIEPSVLIDEVKKQLNLP